MSYGRRPQPLRWGPAPGGRRGGKIRLLLGLAIAGLAILSYLGSSEYNPVTGEEQHLSLTTNQEIALGLQAAPELIAQFGGKHSDPRLQAVLDELGNQLVQNSVARDTGWEFDFHLLADENTINAFALPGGPVFITAALFERLTTAGQLAGVIGHEIGHVLARHSAQRMAQAQLTQGLTGAVVVGMGDERSAQMAVLVGQMINMSYGREDELQSDQLGVQIMSDAGYDPRSMIEVMKILAEARPGAAPPEFFSTHPNPENRITRIEEAIRARFPGGVPGGLAP